MRYFVISEPRGLVWTGSDPDDAERAALVASVITARTVYLHDRTTETQRKDCPL
jgi:hypothetical protein